MVHFPMAKKNDGGFQSAAGLVRYFDTESDKGIKISPKFVIGLALATIVIVIMANIFWPANV